MICLFQGRSLHRGVDQRQRCCAEGCGHGKQAFTETDAGIMRRFSDVLMQGRVTHTEAYFIEVLAGKDPTATKMAKMQRRVASMAKHGITTSAIHATVWQKVAEVL